MSNSVHRPLHVFGVWFKQYKANLLKKKMLKPIRMKAGLGNQPLQFTTNASESMNAVLKWKMDYKMSELPEFLDKLKKVVDEQEHELERAVINKGKYRLCSGGSREGSQGAMDPPFQSSVHTVTIQDPSKLATVYLLTFTSYLLFGCIKLNIKHSLQCFVSSRRVNSIACHDEKYYTMLW